MEILEEKTINPRKLKDSVNVAVVQSFFVIPYNSLGEGVGYSIKFCMGRLCPKVHILLLVFREMVPIPDT